MSDGMEPLFILLFDFPNVSDPPNRPVTEQVVREAYELFRERRFAPVEQMPMGEPKYCFANVAQLVEDFGGELVTGWVWNKFTEPMNQSQNVYAKGNFETHAVWRTPDERVIEVTPNQIGSLFLPHDAVEPNQSAYLSFCDTEEHADELLPIEPGGTRTLIRL